MRSRVVAMAAGLLMVLGPSEVFAQATAFEVQAERSDLLQFVPRPDSRKRLDFGVWDATLKEIVFYGGPTLRVRAPAAAPGIGSRLVRAHDSAYRLDGNRVMFELLNDEGKAGLAGYVRDLEEIANTRDLPRFPRDEQLAFWLNLHNAIVVAEIAQAYRVQRPSRLRNKAGESFHDAPRVTIQGVQLSLRDIREGIVYANWRDPLVIYGFFQGDIGSPSLSREAFTGRRVWEQLRREGGNYANGLRGFDTTFGPARVSEVYWNAAPWLFPSFERDVRAHLKTLLDEELQNELDAYEKPLKRVPYEKTVADMTGGFGIQYGEGQDALTGVRRNNFSDFVREHVEKRLEIRRRGLVDGTVTIEDIPTVDPDLPPEDKIAGE